MVQHHHQAESWWCLPGGGIEPGETPAQAALRELQEECRVAGRIIRQTSYLAYEIEEDDTYTFLVDIGNQAPQVGGDPEFPEDEQVIVNMAWLALSEIPERDRTFLWAAGLLGVDHFYDLVSRWGEEVSLPGFTEQPPGA